MLKSGQIVQIVGIILILRFSFVYTQKSSAIDAFLRKYFSTLNERMRMVTIMPRLQEIYNNLYFFNNGRRLLKGTVQRDGSGRK